MTRKKPYLTRMVSASALLLLHCTFGRAAPATPRGDVRPRVHAYLASYVARTCSSYCAMYTRQISACSFVEINPVRLRTDDAE